MQWSRLHKVDIDTMMTDSKTFKLPRPQAGEGFKKKTNPKNSKCDTYNHRQLIRAQQLDQAWDQASLDHHLNALISAICEVRDSPTRIGQHLPVVAVQQTDEGGEDLFDRLQRGRRVLVATEVRHRPRHVSQVASLQASKKTEGLGALNAPLVFWCINQDRKFIYCFIVVNYCYLIFSC